MRVRVRFRYNSDTGEVETFLVEDIGGARPGADHDAVHDAITADIARVVERNAEIEEVQGAAQPAPPLTERTSEPAETGPREARPVSE
jgi:hypothetical protein